MVRLLRIDDCADCRHQRVHTAYDSECALTGMQIPNVLVNETPVMPDWCPLPEAEDDDGGVARTLARLDEMERLRARNAELKAALRDAGG